MNNERDKEGNAEGELDALPDGLTHDEIRRIDDMILHQATMYAYYFGGTMEEHHERFIECISQVVADVRKGLVEEVEKVLRDDVLARFGHVSVDAEVDAFANRAPALIVRKRNSQRKIKKGQAFHTRKDLR